MRFLSTLFCMTAMSLALSAEGFVPLMKTAQSSWPEKRHIGVICDYRVSKSQVMDLAQAAGEGYAITVADTRTLEKGRSAAQILANLKADFAVLLPGDPNFYDGSFGATLVVQTLAHRGLPAVGTSPKALNNGAVFAIGEASNGQLLVTDRLLGTVDVILPGRTGATRSSLVLPETGMATIKVHSAR
jgi:hypothetical protein